MTAVGPLKVLMKPILTVFSCAKAEPLASPKAIAAAITFFIMMHIPLVRRTFPWKGQLRQRLAHPT